MIDLTVDVGEAGGEFVVSASGRRATKAAIDCLACLLKCLLWRRNVMLGYKFEDNGARNSKHCDSALSLQVLREGAIGVRRLPTKQASQKDSWIVYML